MYSNTHTFSFVFCFSGFLALPAAANAAAATPPSASHAHPWGGCLVESQYSMYPPPIVVVNIVLRAGATRSGQTQSIACWQW